MEAGGDAFAGEPGTNQLRAGSGNSGSKRPDSSARFLCRTDGARNSRHRRLDVDWRERFSSGQLLPNKFSEGDDILWTHGSHSIKFGITFDRIEDNTSQSLFLGGNWSFASLSSFLAGRATTLLGPPLGESDGYKDFRTLFITPYFQDDWKVTSKLTLNLGLRYDWEGNPTEVNHVMTTLINAPFGKYTPVTHAFASNPSTKTFDPRNWTGLRSFLRSQDFHPRRFRHFSRRDPGSLVCWELLAESTLFD